VFGLGPPLPVSIVSVGFVGGGFVVYGSASLTLVQALAPAALRGRLTSVFSLLYWGMMPVGGLIGGFSAQAFSGANDDARSRDHAHSARSARLAPTASGPDPGRLA